jgi:hypothetical protein
MGLYSCIVSILRHLCHFSGGWGEGGRVPKTVRLVLPQDLMSPRRVGHGKKSSPAAKSRGEPAAREPLGQPRDHAVSDPGGRRKDLDHPARTDPRTRGTPTHQRRRRRRSKNLHDEFLNSYSNEIILYSFVYIPKY